MALDLRQRGIVLAVSSKNTDEVARTPFEQHPEMLLKLDHIAVFQANWNDKATNIQAIAEELSLSLDSIVFLDDNPAERGLVRKLLPQVAVPELPEDPSAYARTLAAGGYFEAVTLAAEDLKRAGFYQDNAKRANLKRQAGGVDAYLASLDMTITFQPFDAKGRGRIVQLINKSNQYNLTTRRYTEPEILELERDPKAFTLQARCFPRFTAVDGRRIFIRPRPARHDRRIRTTASNQSESIPAASCTFQQVPARVTRHKRQSYVEVQHPRYQCIAALPPPPAPGRFLFSRKARKIMPIDIQNSIMKTSI